MRQPLGIAMFASGADLGAARYGIPRRVSPFDMRIGGHDLPRSSAGILRPYLFSHKVISL